MLDIGALNYLAILLAGGAKFFVGGLLFSKIIFDTLWLQELGISNKSYVSFINKLLARFGLCLLVSFSFSVLLQMLALDLRSSIAVAVIVAIGITSAQLGLSFSYDGRNIKLFLIYAIQSVAEFVIVVLILCLM